MDPRSPSPRDDVAACLRASLTNAVCVPSAVTNGHHRRSDILVARYVPSGAHVGLRRHGTPIRGRGDLLLLEWATGSKRLRARIPSAAKGRSLRRGEMTSGRRGRAFVAGTGRPRVPRARQPGGTYEYEMVTDVAPWRA